MKGRIYIPLVVLVILLLAAGTCRRAGSWLVKDDAPLHADVMVLLMGNLSDRVLQVDDLYKQGTATRVWIVEPYSDDYQTLEDRGVHIFTDTDRALRALGGLGIPAERVEILPGNASSTKMEAESVRDYLRTAADVDTLLLVSSSYHTRRAFKIFKTAFRAMEDPPVLVCSASDYSDFQPEKWWKEREDIQEVVLEYMKMTSFFLFEKRKLKRGR